MNRDLFNKLPIFQGLSDEQCDHLMPLFNDYQGETECLLFEQGDKAEYLYYVVEGEVTIRYKPEDSPEIVITRIKPGGVVGWSAMLGNRAYTSGAVCTQCSQLMRVRGKALRDLCEKNPDIGAVILERLANVVSERLSHTHTEVFNLLKSGILKKVNSS
jgi:CRP/FNR family cyclic AMP-dependent transcriptional regulator